MTRFLTSKAREHAREYDRKRGLDPARKLANRLRYKQRMSTAEGRAKENTQKKKWAQKNRLKRKCNIAVGNAMRRGKIKCEPCERCGSNKNIHAHHEDYNKPLDITWLCAECHGKRHREINEEKRQKSNDLRLS